jgi:hypothetical protein
VLLVPFPFFFFASARSVGGIRAWHPFASLGYSIGNVVLLHESSINLQLFDRVMEFDISVA